MAHTFLSLDMNLISKATKGNVPTFKSGLFSNDGEKTIDGEWLQDEDGNWINFPSRMLIDGRNDKGELVHPMSVLLKWTQWDAEPESTIQALLDDSIEYTAAEFNALKSDVDSIWYVEPEAET